MPVLQVYNKLTAPKGGEIMSKLHYDSQSLQVLNPTVHLIWSTLQGQVIPDNPAELKLRDIEITHQYAVMKAYVLVRHFRVIVRHLRGFSRL
jgi:hypothetical protein